MSGHLELFQSSQRFCFWSLVSYLGSCSLAAEQT